MACICGFGRRLTRTGRDYRALSINPARCKSRQDRCCLTLPTSFLGCSRRPLDYHLNLLVHHHQVSHPRTAHRTARNRAQTSSKPVLIQPRCSTHRAPTATPPTPPATRPTAPAESTRPRPRPRRRMSSRTQPSSRPHSATPTKVALGWGGYAAWQVPGRVRSFAGERGRCLFPGAWACDVFFTWDGMSCWVATALFYLLLLTF